MWPQYLDRDSLPEWHKKPLFLSKEEIADPQLVFKALFEMYGMDSYRSQIMLLRDAALQCRNQYKELKDYTMLYMFEQWIRTAEAIYLIYDTES